MQPVRPLIDQQPDRDSYHLLRRLLPPLPPLPVANSTPEVAKTEHRTLRAIRTFWHIYKT
ncbi:hypothetical protein DPMN_122836 [Dreissena polymorpha]|uniref:Uncharacterized protein n=1 Tax=Dreissena polymorpha TaxID=45954 RepID=A0A9D4GPQ0_DREPO|nr:hypothetical protein DPMN_122836 [Dreissena polymorpha]